MVENALLLFMMLWISMRVARIIREQFLATLVSKLRPAVPPSITLLNTVVILLLVYMALAWVEGWLKSQTQFELVSGLIGGVLGFGMGLCGFDFSESDIETAQE